MRGSVGAAWCRVPVPCLKGSPILPASLPISGLAATRSRDRANAAPRTTTFRRSRAFAPC
ncbi:protein of unassigned function [Methylobacterium oryzae CBMB20]|uniref:Protein of unassigned function n=1 Tax=Methylobacterium oryzae CBMB20 TaxID=693986 RepID=A0A089P0Y1_9HYPH|nr:protein of unassigned function [Methylobacterium oryzae CBMB20]